MILARAQQMLCTWSMMIITGDASSIIDKVLQINRFKRLLNDDLRR